jgi:hypothetical protein
MKPDETAWRGIYHVRMTDESILLLSDNNYGSVPSSRDRKHALRLETLLGISAFMVICGRKSKRNKAIPVTGRGGL